MTALPTSHPYPYVNAHIDIPPDVALCPYCGGKLIAYVNGWEEPDEGDIWDVIEIDLQCEHEDIDNPNDHTYMPYVYWLPVEKRIIAWLNRPENKVKA
jgi:hypothetical protein